MQKKPAAQALQPEAPPPPLPRFARTGMGLLVVAVVALFLALDWSWKEGYVYAAGGVVVVALCLGEYEQMARRLGIHMPRSTLLYGGVGVFLLQWAGWAAPGFPDPYLSALAVVALMTAALLADRVLRAQVEGSLETVGALAMGLIYVPVLLGFMTAVRAEWGIAGLVTVIAVGKSSSSGAYIVGKNFGRVHITPLVSPRKTLEGVFGAFALAMLVSYGLTYTPWALMGRYEALGLGALAAGAGILGDLAESLLKRQAGMKDSGRLLPGMGGALDMVDDLLFVAPVSFVFLRVVTLFHQGG
jgi:phosphatidate cytidylyltransferase